jgi:Elongation factor Tu C-terminal domain
MYSADFEAEVILLSPEEGGLREPRQGIRPDLHYDGADEVEGLWIIHPIFLDEVGRELPEYAKIPQLAKAHFYILNRGLCNTVHKQRLKEGTRFQLQEGHRIIAQGIVTEILGLHEELRV